jgi:hypothetical protein
MHKQSPTDDTLTPLPTLLNVVGEELHHLAAAVERLHSVVELPGLREALRDAKCHDVLQGIDHVTQNLTGLSHFLTTLASRVPGEWSLDTGAACDVILVASLSERLRCPGMERLASRDNDDCEFF